MLFMRNVLFTCRRVPIRLGLLETSLILVQDMFVGIIQYTCILYMYMDFSLPLICIGLFLSLSMYIYVRAFTYTGVFVRSLLLVSSSFGSLYVLLSYLVLPQ